IIMIIRSGWKGRRLCWRKLGKAANLDALPPTIQCALVRKGYHQCKACKKPFLNRENQKQR
ncbi:hypothetical protein DFP73DRAFT_457081, partial [Morchella snyderi]